MQVGTVVGPVVAPVQHPFLRGRPLLLVRIEDPGSGDPAGEGTWLAVDRVGAAPGEKVLVLKEGSSARWLHGVDEAPVRTVIVGIVDEIEEGGRLRYRHGSEER